MDTGANERIADTRFNHFNKRRYQAMAVIQMRINEDYKLGKAKQHKLTHADAIRSVGSCSGWALTNNINI